MSKYIRILSLLGVILSALTVSAQAQTVLQSRGSNVPGGNIACTGQDITIPVQFTGSNAFPVAANTAIVGAEVLLSTVPSVLQHVFVGITPTDILNNAAGFNGNGFLVTMGPGQTHVTNLFPLHLNAVAEVAGYKINTTTPTINVTFNCNPPSQIQLQIIIYFIQF